MKLTGRRIVTLDRVVGVLCLLGAVALAIYAVGTWWWLGWIPLALVGGAGIVEG